MRTTAHSSPSQCPSANNSDVGALTSGTSTNSAWLVPRTKVLPRRYTPRADALPVSTVATASILLLLTRTLWLPPAVTTPSGQQKIVCTGWSPWMAGNTFLHTEPMKAYTAPSLVPTTAVPFSVYATQVNVVSLLPCSNVACLDWILPPTTA